LARCQRLKYAGPKIYPGIPCGLRRMGPGQGIPQLQARCAVGPEILRQLLVLQFLLQCDYLAGDLVAELVIIAFGYFGLW